MARPQEICEQQIIEMSKELIEADGFDKFSMRTLAVKCNVAASTLYLHFDNKLDIIIAVVSKFWEECFAGFNTNHCKNFFEAARTIYFHILGYLEKFKVKWLNYFSAMNSSDKIQGRRMMERYVSRIHTTILTLLEKFNGEFDSDFYIKTDKDYLAHFIFDNMMGMLLRFSHNYDSLEEILKRILIG